MTAAQIAYALTEKGLSFNNWYTLEDSFQYLTMNSDKNLHFYPKAVQFYFSELNEYLVLRYTHGDKIEYTGGAVPAGYAQVQIHDDQYLIKIEPGGITDASTDDAGVYHEIFSYDCICGMHYK